MSRSPDSNEAKRHLFTLLVCANIVYFGLTGFVACMGDWTGVLVGVLAYVVFGACTVLWFGVKKISYIIWPEDDDE